MQNGGVGGSHREGGGGGERGGGGSHRRGGGANREGGVGGPSVKWGGHTGRVPLEGEGVIPRGGNPVAKGGGGLYPESGCPFGTGGSHREGGGGGKGGGRTGEGGGKPGGWGGSFCKGGVSYRESGGPSGEGGSHRGGVTLAGGTPAWGGCSALQGAARGGEGEVWGCFTWRGGGLRGGRGVLGCAGGSWGCSGGGGPLGRGSPGLTPAGPAPVLPPGHGQGQGRSRRTDRRMDGQRDTGRVGTAPPPPSRHAYTFFHLRSGDNIKQQFALTYRLASPRAGKTPGERRHNTAQAAPPAPALTGRGHRVPRDQGHHVPWGQGHRVPPPWPRTMGTALCRGTGAAVGLCPTPGEDGAPPQSAAMGEPPVGFSVAGELPGRRTGRHVPERGRPSR